MRTCLLAALVATSFVHTLPAQAPSFIGIHAGMCGMKATRDQAVRRAVEAMGVQEKFLYAGTTTDGHAWGWNERTTVVVMTTDQPLPGYVNVIVLCAGTDNKEAERLRHVIQEYLATGKGSDNPPEYVCSPDLATRVCTAPAVEWASDVRFAANTVRHFAPVAELTLEKRAFQTRVLGPNFVLGGGPVSANAVLVLPEGSATKLNFMAVSFGPDQEGCEGLVNELLTGVVKTLY